MATVTKKKLKQIQQIDFAFPIIQMFEEETRGSADSPNWYDSPPETWTELQTQIWDMCFEVQNRVLSKVNEILDAKKIIDIPEKGHSSKSLEQMVFKNDSELEGEEDNLLSDCIEYAKSEGKIRRGTLQRKFKLGYNRAGRIMGQMEAKGIFNDGKTGRYDNDREIIN